jgi:hypothetical protein
MKMDKPKFALLGVEAETLIVQRVEGYTLSNAAEAVVHGLIPLKTTWEAAVGKLFETITFDEFLSLAQ